MNEKRSKPAAESADTEALERCKKHDDEAQAPREIGGRDGPDPTRFGDWEKNGRCIDF